MAPRAVSAGGALVLFGSLTLAWFEAPGSAGGTRAVDAWEHYARTDLILAGLAVTALAGACLPGRRRIGAGVRLAAAVTAFAIVVRAVAGIDAGLGAQVAQLGAAAIGVGALGDLPLRRLGPLLRPVLRLSEWGEARITPLVLSPWVLAPTAVLVTWPVAQLGVGGGRDSSWIAGLAMAVHQGLDFGSDIVYTSGPLGFLTVPRLYYPPLAVLGVAWIALVQTALAATILTLARGLHVLVAFVLTLAALSALRITGADAALVSLVFILCIAVLRSPAGAPTRLDRAIFVGAGVIAAIGALIKLSTGATIIVLFGLTALVARQGRATISVLLFLGSFAVSLLALWGLTGQVLTDLPLYLTRSLEIVSGYGAAMQMEAEGREWEYPGALAVTVIVLAVAWAGTHSWSRARSAAALALTVLFLFAMFKQGFVRHDAHSLIFFASAIFAALAFLPELRGPEGRALGVVAVTTLALAFVAVSRPASATDVFDPRSSATAVGAVAEQLRSPDAFRAESISSLREWEAIDARTLGLLRGRSVHVWPGEAAAAFAHPELEWRPLPVFQGYVAYTAALDRVNADFLRSDEAPERILRTTEYEPFETPDALLTMFCRYREIRATEKWQVLARVRPRCGAPEPVASVATRTGRPVEVPAAAAGEGLLFARLRGLEPGLGEGLRGALWKPYPRSYRREDGTGGTFTPEIAGHTIPVHVPARQDFTGPFRLDPEIGTLSLFVGTPGAHQDRPIRVDFYRLPLHSPAANARAARN